MDYLGSGLSVLGFLEGLEDEGQRENVEHDIYEKLAGWLYGNPEQMTYQQAYDKGIINYIPEGRNPGDTGVFNTGSEYLGALAGISEMYYQKRNILGAQQQNEQTSLRNKFGETLGTQMAQSREASAKSGFASSGAIQTATEKQLRGVMGEYGLGRQSVYDTFQGKFIATQEETENKIGEAEAYRREMELAMIPLEHAFAPNWGGGASFGTAARRTTLEAQFRREYMDYLDQGGDKSWEDWYKTTYPQYWSEERGGTGGPGDEGEDTSDDTGGGGTGEEDDTGGGEQDKPPDKGDEDDEEPDSPIPPPLGDELPPPGGQDDPMEPDIPGPPTPELPNPPITDEEPPASDETNTTQEAQDSYQDYVNNGGDLSFEDWIKNGQPKRPSPVGRKPLPEPTVHQGENAPPVNPAFEDFLGVGSTGRFEQPEGGTSMLSQTNMPRPYTNPLDQADAGSALALQQQADFSRPIASTTLPGFNTADLKQEYAQTQGTTLGFSPVTPQANPVLDTLQQKQKELDTFTNELTKMKNLKVGQTIKMPTVGNYYFNKRLSI